jgi:hypothetical protein
MAIEPTDIKQLEDPAFLLWVEKHHGLPVEPDEQDLDPRAVARTPEKQAHLYRIGQARKLMRLWGEWKAETN